MHLCCLCQLLNQSEYYKLLTVKLDQRHQKPYSHYKGGTEAAADMTFLFIYPDCLMLLKGGINEFTQQF